MPAPDVVVLDGAQRTALACVRSLGRRHLNVAVAESQPRPLAAASRYCNSFISCPDASAEPGRFVEWLFELGRSWPGVVVFPVTDVTVPPCLVARDQGAHISTVLPTTLSYAELTDKFRLTELAAHHSLRAPRTLAVKRADVSRIDTDALSYPVVIKPRWSAANTSQGFLRRAVSYAGNAAELRSMLMERLVDDSDEFLIQEYVRGHGFGVFALFDRGRPLQFFAHRRIREKPPSGGVSVLSRSEPLDPVLVEQVSQLLEHHAWHGVAMLEFKRDDAGAAWLIEVNARLWGSVQLSVDCGVDFPAMLYEMAMQTEPSVTARYPVGRHLRWLLGDLDSLYLTLRSAALPVSAKAASIGRFCVPWWPGMRYEVCRFSDLRPAVVAWRKYLAQLMDGK